MAYIDRINPNLAAGRFLFTEDGFVLKDPKNRQLYFIQTQEKLPGVCLSGRGRNP